MHSSVSTASLLFILALGAKVLAATEVCIDAYSHQPIQLYDVEPVQALLEEVQDLSAIGRQIRPGEAPSNPPRVRVAPVDQRIAALALCDDQPTLLYSNLMLAQLLEKQEGIWAVRGLLGHEVGHHVWNHLFDRTNDKSNNDKSNKEKQADRFAGQAICLLGGRSQQAILSLNLTSPDGGHGYASRAAREQEVLGGWSDAMSHHRCAKATRLTASTRVERLGPRSARKWANSGYITADHVIVEEDVRFDRPLTIFANRLEVNGATLWATELHLVVDELRLLGGELKTDGGLPGQQDERRDAGDLVILAHRFDGGVLSARGAPGKRGDDGVVEGTPGDSGRPGTDARCADTGPYIPAREGENGQDGGPGEDGHQGGPGGDGGRILVLAVEQPKGLRNFDPGVGGEGGDGAPGGQPGAGGEAGKDCHGVRAFPRARAGEEGPPGKQGKPGRNGNPGRYEFLAIQPGELARTTHQLRGDVGEILRFFKSRISPPIQQPQTQGRD